MSTVHTLRSRRWASQLAHVGVAVLVVGIALSGNLMSRTQVALQPGDTAQFAGYTLTYVDTFNRVESNRNVTGALMQVAKDGHPVTELQPRLNQYANDRESIASPDVHGTFAGDLYLSLRALDQDQVTLDVFWFPYIWLVWFGGLLIAAGGLWAFATRKQKADTVEVTS